MNYIKIKYTCILTIFLIIMQCVMLCTFNNYSSAVMNEDVYDVILFWGQSNMTGYCGIYDAKKAKENGTKNETERDERYEYWDSNSVNNYSKKTGIDKEFLANSVQMNWVKISQEKNTVFDYNYLNNKLIELDEKTQKVGELLKYDSGSKKLIKVTEPNWSDYSIQRSYGTNIVPQFCKTYYQKTGHKVVCVLAGNGGEKIANFLPSTDTENHDKQMIYEAMVEKYKAAIKCLESKGYTVKNRIWVSFQGEADANLGTSISDYKRIFFKVHNGLKKDLKITKGVIIETSTLLGKSNYTSVKNINAAQVQLANNSDIILGSSYAYDRFIPDEKNYNSSNYSTKIYLDSTGKKIKYNEALEIAKLSMCDPHNTIHFTSAALSQIGKETAIRLADTIDTTPPSLSVGYSTTEPTNQNVVVTIKTSEPVQATTGWTLSSDKKTLTKTYIENKTEEVEVKDLEGNKTKQTIKVSNIDKTAPTVTLKYSTTKNTKQNVKATLTTDEEVGEVEGWTLSEDKKTLTKTYKKNTTETVSIKDLAGNETKQTIKISNIDKTAPTVSVKYSTKEPTNQNVIVTLTAKEELQEVEGWTLSSDKKVLTKQYEQNIENEEIIIKDIVGNETKQAITINNIDKVAPKVTVKYSTTKNTKQNVKVTLTTDEEIGEVEGWILSEDKKTLTKTYKKNTTETVSIKDLVGNETKQAIKVSNIDKTAPTVSVNYSTTEPTNQNVTVTLTAKEELQEVEGWTLSSDKKVLTKQYEQNIENEEIIIKDIVGNETKQAITINNIDKVAPTVTVKYSTIEKTNKNVIVTLITNKEVQAINGWTLSKDKKQLSKEYSNNTTETITIKDLVGNETKQTITINNIDKTPEQVKKVGDVNENNKIDIGDILLLKRYIAYTNSTTVANKHSNWKISDEKIKIGDINKNGKIDIGDILKLQRYISASNSKEVAQKHKDWLNL